MLNDSTITYMKCVYYDATDMNSKMQNGSRLQSYEEKENHCS